MRALWIIALFASPALAQADYSRGVSGVQAAELVADAMRATGIQNPRPNAPIRPFPACNATPSVSPLNGGWATAEISCSSPRWTRAMRTNLPAPQFQPTERPNRAVAPDVDQMMVVALKRSMQIGEMIGPADVTLVPRSTRSAADIFVDPQLVIGRRLKSTLGAEQILHLRHLEPDWLVQSGTPLALQVSVGAISVVAPGEALENGRLGDVIELRNLSSGEIVNGIVNGENSVILRPNIP